MLLPKRSTGWPSSKKQQADKALGRRKKLHGSAAWALRHSSVARQVMGVSGHSQQEGIPQENAKYEVTKSSDSPGFGRRQKDRPRGSILNVMNSAPDSRDDKADVMRVTTAPANNKSSLEANEAVGHAGRDEICTSSLRANVAAVGYAAVGVKPTPPACGRTTPGG